MFLVVSYPKSGATWFQFLMHACKYGPPHRSIEVLKSYPQIHNKNYIDSLLSENLPYFFVKSHLPYSRSLPYFDKIKACIYLSRNPVDIIFSELNHHTNEGSLRLKFNYFKKKYFKHQLKLNQEMDPDSWNYHVKSWLQENSDFNLYHISYDELLLRPFETISKLNEQWNLNFTNDAIIKAIEACNITELRKLEMREIKNKTKGMFFSKKRRLTKTFLRTNFFNVGGSYDIEEIYNLHLNKEEISHTFKDYAKLLGYEIDELIQSKFVN